MELDFDNAEQIIGWRQRKLDDLPHMTAKMMIVLQALRNAKQSGYPFISLNIHGRSARSLIQRDWIIRSKGLDGVRYKITGRGLNALKIYEGPLRYRKDGLCPDCGKHERKIGNTGFVYAYCEECQHKRDNEAYKKRGNRLNPKGLCAKCKTNKRLTYPSGHTIAYCKSCRDRMRKSEKRRKMKRLLKRIECGEFIPCIRCKERQRYYTQRTVYDYCHSCYRDTQNEYMTRKQSETARDKYSSIFNK